MNIAISGVAMATVCASLSASVVYDTPSDPVTFVAWSGLLVDSYRIASQARLTSITFPVLMDEPLHGRIVFYDASPAFGQLGETFLEVPVYFHVGQYQFSTSFDVIVPDNFEIGFWWDSGWGSMGFIDGSPTVGQSDPYVLIQGVGEALEILNGYNSAVRIEGEYVPSAWSVTPIVIFGLVSERRR